MLPCFVEKWCVVSFKEASNHHYEDVESRYTILVDASIRTTPHPILQKMTSKTDNNNNREGFRGGYWVGVICELL